MFNHQVLMGSRELKEYVLLQYLKEHSCACTYEEITRETGYGVSSIELARKGLEREIFERDFCHKLFLEKVQGKREIRLKYGRRKDLLDFEREYIQNVSSVKFVSHLLQHPEMNVLREAGEFGLSHTTARGVIEVLERELEKHELRFSFRGFVLYGAEEKIREWLFQFFHPLYGKDFWPIERISKARCEEFALELIKSSKGGMSRYSGEFESFLLRIGVFFHRYVLLNERVEREFLLYDVGIEELEKLRLYQAGVSLMIPIETCELRYLYFLLLITGGNLVETRFYRENREKIGDILQVFKEEVRGLSEREVKKFKEKVTQLLFKRRFFNYLVFTVAHFSDNKARYASLVERLQELFFCEESLERVYFINTLIEAMHAVLQKKRKKILIEGQKQVAQGLKCKIQEVFSERFHLHFLEKSSEKSADVVVRVCEEAGAGYSVCETPVLYIKEELSFSDYLEIQHVLEED